MAEHRQDQRIGAGRDAAAAIDDDGAVQRPHRPEATAQFGDVPALDVSASYDPAGGKTAVFVVNRSQSETISSEIIWQSEAPRQVQAVYQVAGTHPKAANSFESPNVLVARQLAIPPLDGKKLTLELPPLSFTVISAC